MFHPVRGGNRGGRDQFTWDEVKNDKHRENYLGHSVMAPVGRWQNGRDLTWYAKDGNDAAAKQAAAREELARVRATEEEAMMVALGLKKATKTDPNAADVHKTKEELARVMANLAQDEADATGAALGTVPDVDTGISGLGSGRNARMMPQNVGNAPTQLPGNVDLLADVPAAIPMQPLEAKMDSGRGGGEKRKGPKEKKDKKEKKSSSRKHKRDRRSRSRSRSPRSARHGRSHARRHARDEDDGEEEVYFREVAPPSSFTSSRPLESVRHRRHSRSRSRSRERHHRSRSRSPYFRGTRRRHASRSRSRSPPPRPSHRDRSRSRREEVDYRSERRRSLERGDRRQHRGRE